MRFILLAAATSLALAACDRGPTVTADNAKPSEVAQKMREAAGDGGFVRPGKWQSTVTIEDINMPGIPAEYASKMKEQMAKARQFESCLTPAEAKRPKGDFFAADKSCKYDHFEMAGGKIGATMRCAHGEIAQSMTMQGSYSPDEYHMAMSSKMEGAGPQSGTTMKMRIDARRIGDCDGSEAATVAN